MKIFLRAAGVLGACAALAACDWLGGEARPPSDAPPAEAPAGAFRHQIGGDLSGFYMPTAPIDLGQWRLDHVFIGQAAEFASWEGGQRSGTFAPVMIEFVDPNSPMVQTELGESRSGRVRVLPTRYEVTDERVVFEGRGEGVGEVQMDARLDSGALATARRNLGGDEAPVLTGTLRVAGRSAPVSMRWWAGD